MCISVVKMGISGGSRRSWPKRVRRAVRALKYWKGTSGVGGGSGSGSSSHVMPLPSLKESIVSTPSEWRVVTMSGDTRVGSQ